MFSWLKSIKHGFKNIFKWLPVIWADRDFDYHYLYTILNKKLSLMEKFFYSADTWSTSAKNVAKEIKIARILTDRLLSYEYMDNYTSRDPRIEEFDLLDYMEKDPEYPNWNRFVDPGSEEHKKAYKRAYKRAQAAEAQDREYLFNLIRDKIERWWD